SRFQMPISPVFAEIRPLYDILSDSSCFLFDISLLMMSGSGVYLTGSRGRENIFRKCAYCYNPLFILLLLILAGTLAVVQFAFDLLVKYRYIAVFSSPSLILTLVTAPAFA
ncbi:hypothetical protein PMAYCL1PPCAC_30532, partial [Pristionchus mayeri]